jgi:tetratricopeptide (TPR) repeat protein
MLFVAVAALLGALEGAPAVRPSGADPDGARALERLHSPFLEEREAAARALGALGERGRPALEEALGDRDFRVRAAALAGLGSADRTALDRLARLLAEDPSLVVRRAAAEALAAAGEPGLAAWRDASGRIRPEDRRAFLLAYVVAGLQAVEQENSSLGGGLKGHYDGQFERLSRWKDTLSESLEEVVRRPDFPARMKNLALHALADAGPAVPPALVQRLARINEVLASSGARPDPGSDRAELEDNLLYCLARLGEEKPLREKLRDIEKQLANDPLPSKAFELGYKWSRLREYDLALHWYEEAIRLSERIPEQGGGTLGVVHYNIACIRSRRGEKALAVESLRRAFASGYSDLGWVQQDRDLDPIRSLPEFKELLQAQLDRARGR